MGLQLWALLLALLLQAGAPLPPSDPALDAGGDPEGSAAAAFLQTGDARRLARANCSRNAAVGAPGAGPPPSLRAALRAAPEALSQAANFLNMLFQSNDIREASVAEDVEWYQALVRSMAEGHPWVRRAVLALDAHPLAAKPRLVLQATASEGEILLQDISAAGNRSGEEEWFRALREQRGPQLRKRVLSNDLSSMETPKWQRGDSYVGEPGQVRWSQPFLECRDGKFLPAWAITLSSAFYGLKPDLSPEFKGIVRVDVELRDVSIDQCSSGPGWFAGTHRCDPNSTQCIPQESHGLVLGHYVCRCKPGFYGASGVASSTGTVLAEGSWLACRPCHPGCGSCEDDAPCLAQEDRALRAAVLCCQASCMLAVFLSMLISYHFRQSKRIRASGVVLLETILFGSLLLYFPVFILYFKPSTFRCIVLRWVRTLGFAIVYGTITLKLYRVLQVFLARTAQRVPGLMSSGRVLKLLGLLLLLVLWFLAAWTVAALENVGRNIPLVARTQTARGLRFHICSHDRWDYMMVVAELLLLLWGSSLCFAARAVPSAFHEPRYLGIALHNELLVSAAFHVLRFAVVPSLHPDWTLLLFFAHTHGTVTMTLVLLFIPKFLHAGSPLREEIAAEVYEDELEPRRSRSCLNSSIASAWSERSLDPDDIREELKKLYAQLELLRTRRMASSNPHLPPKRSSRRSLGRSISRRISELPEAAARRSSGDERPRTPGSRRASAKRPRDAPSASLRLRDGGSQHRAAALRKSRSSEHPARGGTAVPVPSGATPELSDSESLDAAPLVCKSASAHNLGGHGQPPQPHAVLLQKSLSVVAGARDEALLAASRAAREQRAPSSGHPMGQGPPEQDGHSPSPAAAPGTASSPLADGGPPQDVSPPGDGKAQKRVTYAPIKSVSVDSPHPSGRVRVVVRRTPPPPPVRYQSLLHRSGDNVEPPEPPTGTALGTPERVPPPSGQGRLHPIPAEVCPWELVQEEMLRKKEKGSEPPALPPPGDTPAAPSSLKPPPQKAFRSLGFAIRALNRSRARSSMKGKSKGSPGAGGREKDGGSGRERPGETPPASPGGSIPEPQPSPSPRGGDVVPSQRITSDSAPEIPNVGDSEGAADGQQDSVGTADAGGLLGSPLGSHELPDSVGHGDVAVRPRDGDGDGDGDEDGDGDGDGDGPHHVELKGPGVPVGGPGGSKAEVCPWESAEQGAEICPWDAKDKEGIHGGVQSHRQPSPPAAPHRWDLPKGTSRSTESARAAVCPWESMEGGSDRAEVCPWETVSAASSREEDGKEEAGVALQGVGTGRELGHSTDLGGTQRAAVCPWEDMEEPSTELMAKQPTVPKVPSKASGDAESKKADICPWEAEAEPLSRVEICPWEGSAAPMGVEGLEKDTHGAPRGDGKPGLREIGDHRAKKAEKGRSTAGHGDTQSPSKLHGKRTEGLNSEPRKSQSAESTKAEICPWEAQGMEGSKAEICPWDAQGMESSKAEICPWDAQGMESSKTEICPWDAQGVEGSKAEICPWDAQGVEGSKAEICPWDAQGVEGSKAEICPWDAQGMEGSKAEICPWDAQGVEGSKAEICPWDAQGVDGSKAEICPWEVAAPHSQQPRGGSGGAARGEKRIRRQAALVSPARSLERGGGSVAPGPWESPGQSRSTESPRVEVCPWEAQGVEAGGREEICPWEGAAPLPKDGAPGRLQSLSASNTTGMGSSGREAVCPWESLGAEEPPPSTQREAPRKLESSESRAAICPWEAAEPEAGQESCTPGVHPGGASPAGRGGRVGASPMFPRKSRGEAVHKPLCRILPAAPGPSATEVCPWEAEGAPAAPSTPGASAVCPWDSPGEGSGAAGGTSPEVCPWDHE